MVVGGKDLVISATDNRETDFLRVDMNGSIVARRRMSSQFLLIRDSASDDEVQVFENARSESSSSVATSSYRNRDEGGDQAQDSAVARRSELEALEAKSRDQATDESKVNIHSLVTLNREFSETHRVKGGPTNFYARVAYRLTDGSLILSGSEYSIPKQDYLSSIVQVDAELKTTISLIISYDQLPFRTANEGSIWAMTRGSTQDVFAAACSVLPLHPFSDEFDENGRFTGRSLDRSKLSGAVVSRLQMK